MIIVETNFTPVTDDNEIVELNLTPIFSRVTMLQILDYLVGQVQVFTQYFHERNDQLLYADT